MSSKNVFNLREQMLMQFWKSDDYRDFLVDTCENNWIESLSSKIQFAKCLGVSGSYITKVFAKKGHLALEQIQTLATALDLNECETAALIDKAMLSRTDSLPLRATLTKRIQTNFSQSYSTQKSAEKALKLAPPANLLFFRIANVLRGKEFRSLKELSSKLRMKEERIKYHLEKMDSYFEIETRDDGNATSYRMASEANQFQTVQPTGCEFDLGLRRLASYSLETRMPLHLVDNGDHYVCTSYMLALTEKQIKEMSVLLAQVGSQIADVCKRSQTNEPRSYVAVCVDMFDASL